MNIVSAKPERIKASIAARMKSSLDWRAKKRYIRDKDFFTINALYAAEQLTFWYKQS